MVKSSPYLSSSSSVSRVSRICLNQGGNRVRESAVRTIVLQRKGEVKASFMLDKVPAFLDERSTDRSSDKALDEHAKKDPLRGKLD